MGRRKKTLLDENLAILSLPCFTCKLFDKSFIFCSILYKVSSSSNPCYSFPTGWTPATVFLQGEPHITLHSTCGLKLKCMQNIRSEKYSLLPYFCMCLGLFNYRLFFKIQTRCTLKYIFIFYFCHVPPPGDKVEVVSTYWLGFLLL